MKRNYIAFLFFVLLFLFPVISDACPMCQGAPSKETIIAYKGITLFLALLPILGGGGIFYWIYLRSKDMESRNKQAGE